MAVYAEAGPATLTLSASVRQVGIIAELALLVGGFLDRLLLLHLNVFELVRAQGLLGSKVTFFGQGLILTLAIILIIIYPVCRRHQIPLRLVQLLSRNLPFLLPQSLLLLV